MQDPFFVVGAHRSGTTLLRLMLNAHPNLAIPFESEFITVFYRRLEKYGDLQQPDNIRRLLRDISAHEPVKKGNLIEDQDAVLSREISSYADLVGAIFAEYAKRKGKPRWGDKTPGYVSELEILWTLFPEARVIHLIRDGRDVALSLRRLNWGSSNLPRVAEQWRWMTTLGRKMGTFLGDRYIEVRYEDVVLETEESLRRLCQFLGEPYDTDLTQFHLGAKLEMPEHSLQWHKNSVRPPDPKKVFTWKREMSTSDRIIFEQIAGQELQSFGYETEGRKSSWGSRFKSLYYSTIRRW